MYPGKYSVSGDRGALSPLRLSAVKSLEDGLSLASDPAGTVNFLDMVNNLQGDSGRGYYLEMSLGSPGQKVLVFLSVSCVQSIRWFLKYASF